MKSFFRHPLVAALVGGLVVAAVMLAFDVGGDGGETVTQIEQAPLAPPSADQEAGRGGGLTASDIYKRDAPGVVFIRAQVVQQGQPSPFDPFPQEQRGEATGTGFVVDDGGHILTNAHVVDGATRVSVKFEDEGAVEAKIVGQDDSTDLALLKVDPKGLDLKPLRLGNSATVKVGDPVLAIGNPFGLDRTLTQGIVSAKQRQIQAPDGFTISNVIQTDAPINPGNSGGPLIDAAGRVIGVNSQIYTGGSGNGNVGIGFAVPINTAKKIIPQLKETGKVERAYLGINGRTIDGSLAPFNLAADQGVLVQTVASDGPAGKAGLRGGDVEAMVQGEPVQLGGDIITAIDGEKVRTMEALADRIGSEKPGTTVTLTILRDGKEQKLKVKLAARPAASTPQQPAQTP